MKEKLAIEGGTPVFEEPIVYGVSGPSAIGDEEINAVTELLRNQQLFRHREFSETGLMEKEELKALLGSEDVVILDVREGRDWSTS